MNQTGLSPDVINDISTMFKHISKQVDNIDREYEAKDIIQLLTKDGGGIEVFTDSFEPIFDDIYDVESRAEDLYTSSFGIDGSTTTPITLSNGFIISAGVAGSSVIHGDKESEIISDKTTISIISYFDKNTIESPPIPSKETVDIYFNHFPRLNELTKEITSWVSSLSRSRAESEHFKWVTKQVKEPVFLDGPLYPADVLTWIMYNNNEFTKQTPLDDWPEMVNLIMQNYVDGINNCVKYNTPVFGVQKTTQSNKVLTSIIEKEPTLDGELPWRTDAELFNAALQPRKENTIIHTPWYRENTIRLSEKRKRVVPMKEYEGIEFKYGTAEDYTREYFYVRPPTQPTVMRIGCPRLLFEQNIITREKAKDIVLSEMIKSYSEPLPIKVADEKIRITRNIRDQFRQLFKTESHIDYNEQRNYN